MEVFLIRALQLILCFSILILLHEGGHFFFAKLFGVRVEKFCLFFDPWKTFKLFRFKGTDYHIGWLPLGGYVTIAGMVDESTKAKELGETIQPWEFRSKPAWQRLLIMVGGVLMNFLVALFIYAMILFSWGETYTPVKEISYGFKFNQTAQQLGFRDGDIPLRTNDVEFQKYNAGNMLRSISQATSVTVLRQGKEVTLNLPGDLSMLEMIKQQPPFMNVLQPSFVDSVGVGTPAQRAGVRAGDRIVAFNGTPISTWNEYMDLRGRMDDVLAAGVPADSQRLRDITLCVQHAGSTSIDTLAFRLDANFQMGTFWHNGYAPIWLLGIFPRRSPPRLGGVERLRFGPSLSLHGRRCTQRGKFRSHWQSFPHQLGLAAFLGADSLHLSHACIHEHPAHPGPGWRPRFLPPLRGHHAPQTERPLHGVCTDSRHVVAFPPDGLCYFQRLLEFPHKGLVLTSPFCPFTAGWQLHQVATRRFFSHSGNNLLTFPASPQASPKNLQGV